MLDGSESLVSIEEYMTSFDGKAARSSLQFVRQGMKEIKEELSCFAACHGRAESPTTLDYDYTDYDTVTHGPQGFLPSLMDEQKEEEE